MYETPMKPTILDFIKYSTNSFFLKKKKSTPPIQRKKNKCCLYQITDIKITEFYLSLSQKWERLALTGEFWQQLSQVIFSS
jgi:hypothetical protein